MEKYSVLMSLYKKEKPDYLWQSIDSILKQTVKPDEIVIVKDGLITSELEEVLFKFQNEYPGLFNIVESKKNLGLGLALNLGLKKCRNNLVARMDTDDISLPDRCEKQLQAFEQDKELTIVGTMVAEFADDNPNMIVSSRVLPTKHEEIYEFGKKRSPFNHPTVMYKKDKVLSVGGYSDLRRNQDVDLFGRMLYAGYKATNINEALLLFRINKNLLKRRRSWENTKSYIAAVRNLWKLGYSSFIDYVIVIIAQMIIFFCPIKIQSWIYKKFLR